ncbi:MAG: LptF/LptG family permease, partial [Muribaculaceae bacterium]|nr:LptF/LptG family permease [Muribaculaceae bacterium]
MGLKSLIDKLKKRPVPTPESAPEAESTDENIIMPQPVDTPDVSDTVSAEATSDVIYEVPDIEAVSEREETVPNPAAQRPKRHFRFGLKILDIYILKKFLGTYFLATLLFLAVIAMFDVTEKLDAFLTAPFSETIFDYFASFLPYFANQLSPLFVFISVIFFTSKMASNSEIIAILASGVSFRRLLWPYMIGATVIAAVTFALSNYIIPPTNVRRIAYTNKYVRNKSVETGINLQLMASPGTVAYFGRFENKSKTGYRFSLDHFEGKTLTSRLTAQSIVYDTTKMYKWTLRDYMIRDFDGTKESVRHGTRLDTII